MNVQVPVPKGYIDSICNDASSLSEPIRNALLSVRRHRFLDGWFRVEFVDHKLDYHHVRFNKDAPSADELSVIYSNQALVTAHNQIFPTSSTSQPSLVAQMLQLMELAPGMKVLEIGTGTGYNAALLAELTGDPSHIFTMECQQTIAEKARTHLCDEGYGAVHVIQSDGYQGIIDAAPFDRLVATAGCSDISPRWLEQLSPKGIMLIPLTHGFSDPLIQLSPDPKDPTCAIGRIAGDSAFMKIQGVLQCGNPWRSYALSRLPEEPEWTRPLLEQTGIPAHVSHQTTEHTLWSFSFFLTLCSRELWFNNRGYGLADPASHTIVIITPEGIESYSATHDLEACERLFDRLLTIHRRWVGLGRPSPSDFSLRLSPKIGFDVSSINPEREWAIERPHFLETIWLP